MVLSKTKPGVIQRYLALKLPTNYLVVFVVETAVGILG